MNPAVELLLECEQGTPGPNQRKDQTPNEWRPLVWVITVQSVISKRTQVTWPPRTLFIPGCIPLHATASPGIEQPLNGNQRKLFGDCHGEWG